MEAHLARLGVHSTISFAASRIDGGAAGVFSLGKGWVARANSQRSILLNCRVVVRISVVRFGWVWIGKHLRVLAEQLPIIFVLCKFLKVRDLVFDLGLHFAQLFGNASVWKAV